MLPAAPQPCDHCQGAQSIRCLLLPDCPPLPSLLAFACAALRLTDTSVPAQISETSHMARELFAPVGGRALGLRSEGSWLAASLQLSCCAPGSSPALLNPAGVRRGRTLGWVGRWTGFCPSNLHGGQLRRARARRAAAQLQASCPLSAGQGPCPPLEQTALWPSEKSQRSAQGRTCQLV